jgi:hypothetical protein
MARKKDNSASVCSQSKEKTRRMAENVAMVGLLLLAIALMAPLFNLLDPTKLYLFKWIYAAGALIYVTARSVNVNDPGDTFRLKRLRRLEFWAGVAFVIGGACWFYNTSRLGEYAGVLAILRPTILMSLVGAMIQIIASWLIASQVKKDKID